jgi:medium-chain acyl-[acyl-carrier-protein] hydrolase
MSMKATGWIGFSRPNPHARLKLFCFPYAGGGAAAYRAWGKELPQDVELCPVQLPGRESRMVEPPFQHLEGLVMALADAIAPQLDRPFAFFGHSMGALVAYELTRTLRRRGLPEPARLLVSAFRAPHLARRVAPIYHLPDEAFLAALRRFNGTPDEILQNADLMELVMPILRADFSVCETYTHRREAPLDLPIVAFGGCADEDVKPAELEPWRELTTSGFSLAMFPGDHFFLDSSRPALLETVSAVLRRVS